MNQENKSYSQPTKSEVQPLLMAFNSRKFEQAMTIGKELLVKYPNAFFICNVLGSCLANLGEKNDSLHFFNKAYEIEPKIPESCSNLGMAFQQLEKFEEASYYFDQAIKLKNDIPEVHFNFAVCLAKSKKIDLAIKSYQKSINLRPDFSYAYFNLGLLYWEINDFENAIKILKKANSITPNNPEILASLGAVFKASGNLKEAENKTLEALKLKIDPKFKFNLAAIKRDQGLLNDAKTLYEETISIDQNFTEAYNNLGEVLRDQGHSNSAKECFEKALNVDSNFSMASYNLGILYQDSGNLNEAIDFFEKSKVFDWQQRICYCAYKNNRKDLFKRMFSNLYNFKHHSPLIASIASHHFLNNETKNNYKFCPDPFSYIKRTPLESLVGKDASFRNDLIQDLNKTEIAERKQGRLINGIQSAGNLLKRDESTFRMLAGLIIVEIDNYLSEFKDFNCEFINSFPNRPEFQSSWYIKMQKLGHLTSHIHETGWLSGVLYLQIPSQTKNPQEGIIEFGYDGDSYPEGLKLPTKKVFIETGDLILFPSSLFHRTLPFDSNEERICIAFDISPPN
jgi:tetratricopeptide (TPR) repeat protein